MVQNTKVTNNTADKQTVTSNVNVAQTVQNKRQSMQKTTGKKLEMDVKSIEGNIYDKENEIGYKVTGYGGSAKFLVRAISRSKFASGDLNDVTVALIQKENPTTKEKIEGEYLVNIIGKDDVIPEGAIVINNPKFTGHTIHLSEVNPVVNNPQKVNVSLYKDETTGEIRKNAKEILKELNETIKAKKPITIELAKSTIDGKEITYPKVAKKVNMPEL